VTTNEYDGLSSSFADTCRQVDAERRTDSIPDEVERLSKLPPHAYDLVREIHGGELGIRIGTLDKLVAKHRKKLGLDGDQERRHSR
jgi:hypothetical protein